MLHEQLMPAVQIAGFSCKIRRLRATRAAFSRASAIGRPALPAGSMIGLEGIVPGPVGAVAVVAPADMRRATAAAVISSRLDVSVGGDAEIDARPHMVMPAMVATMLAVVPFTAPTVVAPVAAMIDVEGVLARIGDGGRDRCAADARKRRRCRRHGKACQNAERDQAKTHA